MNYDNFNDSCRAVFVGFTLAEYNKEFNEAYVSTEEAIDTNFEYLFSENDALNFHKSDF